METIMDILNFLILGLIIIFPILIIIILKRLKTKRVLIIYSVMGLFILGALTWIFAWWTNKSNMILLEHYGYNFNGWNDAERFQYVAQENLKKTKNLETSITGIGWPVKAIFGFVMTIPYLITVYLGKILIDKKNNQNEA
jgi:4-amino-4-deoxy-L-arabinose transferase-like glycosyltransferase